MRLVVKERASVLRSTRQALDQRAATEHRTAWASAHCTPQPGYLSIESAARWADVSSRTVKRWIKAGLPTYQAGPRGKVLVRPGDMDQFLTRRQVTKPDLDAMVEEVMVGLTQNSIEGEAR